MVALDWLGTWPTSTAQYTAGSENPRILSAERGAISDSLTTGGVQRIGVCAAIALNDPDRYRPWGKLGFPDVPKRWLSLSYCLQ